MIQFFAVHFRWTETDSLNLTYSRRMRLIKLQEAHIRAERERIGAT